MPHSLTKDLIRRLAYVRYLHELGVEQSHKPEPFAAVAVLMFHDACEMFLQVAAEHNSLTFSKQRSPDFLDYWLLFEQQASLQVTSKPSMSRLNRARANLKHGGVLPAHGEIEGFRAAVTGFLEDNALLLLGINLDSASLTSMIRSDDIREPLVRAEAALAADSLQSALGDLAIAFTTSLRRFERRPRATAGPLARPYSLTDVTATLSGGYGPHETREIERTLYRMSGAFSEAITVVAYNLDFDSYLLFKTHAPIVHEFMGGRMQVEWMSTDAEQTDPEVVRRCLNFVIDTAIRLEARK